MRDERDKQQATRERECEAARERSIDNGHSRTATNDRSKKAGTALAGNSKPSDKPLVPQVQAKIFAGFASSSFLRSPSLLIHLLHHHRPTQPTPTHTLEYSHHYYHYYSSKPKIWSRSSRSRVSLSTLVLVEASLYFLVLFPSLGQCL